MCFVENKANNNNKKQHQGQRGTSIDQELSFLINGVGFLKSTITVTSVFEGFLRYEPPC